MYNNSTNWKRKLFCRVSTEKRAKVKSEKIEETAMISETFRLRILVKIFFTNV